MNATEVKNLISALERIGVLLGAIHAQQLDTTDDGEKALALSRCGFSNTQIADLLGKTLNAIKMTLHRTRKRAKKGKKKTAPSARKLRD